MNAKPDYFASLRDDLREADDIYARTQIRMKLLYYFLQRKIGNLVARQFLLRGLRDNPVVQSCDLLLINEGGMHKDHVYSLCNKLTPLCDAIVLVPGAGPGRFVFQLARFRPKLIIGFDLYEYKEEWAYVSRILQERFGVESLFLAGGFDVVPAAYINKVDCIISDAVLEHVRDLSAFMQTSYQFLKPDGIFYAGFGPLWFGPGGDHMDWGEDGTYNHLILSPKRYEEMLSAREAAKANNQNLVEEYLDAIEMVRTRLFSYLTCQQYLETFDSANFKKIRIFLKVHTKVLKLARQQTYKEKLDAAGVPLLDRYCSGMYAWLRK